MLLLNNDTTGMTSIDDQMVMGGMEGMNIFKCIGGGDSDVEYADIDSFDVNRPKKAIRLIQSIRSCVAAIRRALNSESTGLKPQPSMVTAYTG